MIESDGIAVAGDGVSQAKKPNPTTRAAKNNIFIIHFFSEDKLLAIGATSHKL
jgi:hypothetical protein